MRRAVLASSLSGTHMGSSPQCLKRSRTHASACSTAPLLTSLLLLVWCKARCLLHMAQHVTFVKIQPTSQAPGACRLPPWRHTMLTDWQNRIKSL